jgi:hypothetical protein
MQERDHQNGLIIFGEEASPASVPEPGLSRVPKNISHVGDHMGSVLKEITAIISPQKYEFLEH